MNNSAIAEETWEDLRKRIFTPEELAESSLWVGFMGELIDARDKGYLANSRQSSVDSSRVGQVAFCLRAVRA